MGQAEEIRHQLLTLAEEEYRVFSMNLLPGIDHVLGVRLPQLRQLAKQLAKGDWQEYLAETEDFYFEEIMLHGMLLGVIQVAPEQRLSLMADFIPKIHSWSVCDSFCSGLKFTQTNRQLVWDFLQPYLQSTAEYEVRFAVIMLMDYYLQEDIIDAVLEHLSAIKQHDYYVKMAIAWALSMALVHFWDKTITALTTKPWEDFTYNKALQKAIESRQITAAQKDQLRSMKRKISKA